MIVSPLTGSNDITLLKTIETTPLIAKWKKTYNIDIENELKGLSEFYLYKCNQTGLHFFVPSSIAGSGQLYAELEEQAWYYMKDKWEYNFALKDLQESKKVIEVGCGRGAFLEHLKDAGIEAEGVEFNEKALEECQSKGLKVTNIDIIDLAKANKNSYDAACTFQVLEHVSNPKEFLLAMLDMVRIQGKLIIAVPNIDTYLKYIPNDLLNQPPHHMSLWDTGTFNKLAELLPVKIVKTLEEPLSLYHVDVYIESLVFRIPNKFKLRILVSRALKLTLKPLLKKFSFLRNLIKGHTLYVCFEKVA